MRTARVFRSGNSQAVRIPREFQVQERELEITKRGDTLVLKPKRKSWAPLIESLARFTDDYMAGGRRQPRRDRRRRAFK